MDAERFKDLIPTRRSLCASTEFSGSGVTTSRLHHRASVLLLIALLLMGAVSTAGAQETSTPAPQGVRGAGQASGYTGNMAELATAIDAFWDDTFEKAGVGYRFPGVRFVEQVTTTACGLADPAGWPFYCAADETIYLQPDRMNSVAVKSATTRRS